MGSGNNCKSVTVNVSYAGSSPGGLTSVGVTSLVVDVISDADCHELECLNGGVCVVNSQQQETCLYVDLTR